VVNQLVGGKGVEFDATKFSWVGAATSVAHACLVRPDTQARIGDFQELLGTNGKRAVFATTGVGSSGYEYPMLFKEVLGANIRLVTGYKGNPEVRLAIEGGEADGYCASWDAVYRGLQPWKEAGTPPYKLIVQSGPEKVAELADVPMARDFARNEEDRQLFSLLDAPGAFAKPFAAPPGIPADRLEILREAFAATWRDPQAIEEIKKADVSLDPKTGPQVLAAIQEILSTPRPVVERYSKLVGR
jgi:tripartite-type tricarboxylate transporter receptor subunit TctC